MLFHAYSPDGQRGLVSSRYGFYAFVALLVALDDGQLLIWLAVVGLALLWHVVYPVLVRAAPRGLYLCHGLEWLMLCGLLLGSGVSASVLAAVMFVLAAANTALWGWAAAGVLALPCVAGAGIIWWAGDGFMRVSGNMVNLVASAGTGCFALVVCAVANRQAIRTAQRGRWHRDRQQTLQRYLPGPLREHLAEGRAGAVARQWMCIAFIDLVGFSELAQRLGVEELNRLLNDFYGAVKELVEQHDGSVAKFLGDGLLCVFPSNAPETNPHAARRAVVCMCALPDLTARLNADWQRIGLAVQMNLCCGVASGYCAIGDWGNPRRWDFTVVGTPVNLAARLQGRAGEHGGLLIDEVTARLLNDAVSLAPGVPVDLKGFEPMIVYRPWRNHFLRERSAQVDYTAPSSETERNNE